METFLYQSGVITSYTYCTVDNIKCNFDARARRCRPFEIKNMRYGSHSALSAAPPFPFIILFSDEVWLQSQPLDPVKRTATANKKTGGLFCEMKIFLAKLIDFVHLLIQIHPDRSKATCVRHALYSGMKINGLPHTLCYRSPLSVDADNCINENVTI